MVKEHEEQLEVLFFFWVFVSCFCLPFLPSPLSQGEKTKYEGAQEKNETEKNELKNCLESTKNELDETKVLFPLLFSVFYH